MASVLYELDRTRDEVVRVLRERFHLPLWQAREVVGVEERMGKASKDKGYRFEASVVNDLRDAGIECRRIPLSGGDPNEPGDIEITRFGLCEAKHREVIGEYLWEWLGDNRALFLKRNRREPLVMMRLDEFVGLLKRR